MTPQEIGYKERARGYVVSNVNNDDEENEVVVDLKKHGVTDRQVRSILAVGRPDDEVRAWCASRADFVAEHGPLRKTWAAVLVAALTGGWPVPEGFIRRRRQMELAAAEADAIARRRAEDAAQAAAPPPTAAERRAALPEAWRRKLEVVRG